MEENEFVIEQTGFNVVGDTLGYDWNTVSTELAKVNLFSTGDEVIITKDTVYGNDVIDAIVKEMFTNNPLVSTIRIVE